MNTYKTTMRGLLGMGISLASMTVAIAPAFAMQDGRAYALPAQPLGKTLNAIALQSGTDLVVDSRLVAGKTAPRISGRLTTVQVLDEALRGSGLQTRSVGSAIVVEPDGKNNGAVPNGPGEDPAAIVVTGTRIRGTKPIGSELITLTRKDIEASGYATTQDIAQTIPQNFGGSPNDSTAAISLNPNSGKNTGSGSSLNLRGLGNESTLVLLNGDRPPLAGFAGVFTDISMIPASAIERIEVVPDGSSAIYGSDAVAGVVNIIPRLNFTGAETSVRLGTADGDSQDIVASQIVGKGWAGGHAVVAYEYYRRSALAASDRRYATDDLRAFGGLDYRGEFASPGTIIAGGRRFAIPAGQDGTRLTAADLLPDQVNLGDSQAMTDLLPRQRRHSLFAAVHQKLGPAVTFYAQGLYSARDFEQRSRTQSDASRTVPVTNPFYVDPIGTHRPIRVEYDFERDLGRELSTGKVEAYGVSAGLQAVLGRWNIDLRGTWGREAERSALLNRVNRARLAVALADTSPATAYNLFGSGSTNPMTIDRIRGSTISSSSGTAWSTSLRADGPLARLPAGELRMAIGSEYRQERYLDGSTISDTSTLTPSVLPNLALPGPRKIRAFYGELLVPIFGQNVTLPGFHRLDLSVALRSEHYSDFGGTTNPKLGIDWEPVEGVRLHGSYGRSFRAPNFDNLRQDPGTMLLFAYTIPDPQSPTGQSNIIVRRGNDPALRPERATTWSAGAELKPAAIPGLRADVTYYSINYRDRITSPAANLFNFLVNRPTYQGIITDHPSVAFVQAFYASPMFINPLGIAPDAVTAYVNAQLQNLSVVRQSGLDVDAAYAFDWAGGKAEVGATAAYIFKIDQALTSGAPVSDVVDTLGNPVDLRVRAHANWTNDRWGASLFVNYLDSYTNLTNVQPEKVKSWTTLDAQLRYRFPQQRGALHGLRVALSATNLLDRDPPYAAYNLGTSVTGYDPDNASPLGRVVALQLTKSW